MSATLNILSAMCRKVKPRFFSSSSINIIDSGLPDVTIPRVSIPELVFSKCAKYESLTALECGITGRKYTYRDLIKKSKNFSKVLRARLGLNDGDVVAILLPNIPEFPVAVLGILQANLIVTTINPVYTPDEISRQLSDSSSKAIITLVSLWETATCSTKLLKKDLPIFTIKTKQTESTPQGAINFSEAIDIEIDCPQIPVKKSEDVAFLPYSSGTTGLPKGVQLTNYNIVANIQQVDSPDFTFVEDTTETHQDVVPVILPMFHIYGFTPNTIYALVKGTKLVTLPKFTPEDYVELLRRHNPHILLLVPPIVLFLATHPMVKREDLQSVRVTFCGAAPLGALDEQRFIEKAGKNVHMMQGYGLTECSPGVTTMSIKLKSEVPSDGSVGRPIPNTLLKVMPIDGHGVPLGPNTPGELYVKGPQVMKGYLDRPEETKTTLVDGWLKTGDIVKYNEDKIFFVTDRLKELIKVKGFQVAPAELEEIVRDFPNVADAAVIGVPHESQGEAPRAYVVPKNGAKIDVKRLEEFVKKKVAHYKQLKGGVEVVETIPKNTSGKIMRRTLKLDYEKKNQSQK